MADERNLFDRFGGVRPMAVALGESPSTVASWKATGRIPATKQRDVLKRGAELLLALTAADVVFPLDLRADVPPDNDVPTDLRQVACKRTEFPHRNAAA